MSGFSFVIKDFCAQPKLDRGGKTDSLKAWWEELPAVRETENFGQGRQGSQRGDGEKKVKQCS